MNLIQDVKKKKYKKLKDKILNLQFKYNIIIRSKTVFQN